MSNWNNIWMYDFKMIIRDTIRRLFIPFFLAFLTEGKFKPRREMFMRFISIITYWLIIDLIINIIYRQIDQKENV